MLALAIILAVLIILALLRFGVSAEYSEDGPVVTARVGLLSITVYPRKEKRKKGKQKEDAVSRKEKKKAKKKTKKKEEEPKEKKAGGLQYFLVILSSIKTSMGRLRRRLLIKRLTIHIITANDDPSKAAMMFGGAYAAFGAITPVLEKHFRIKRRDFQAAADFSAEKPLIYVNAAISLAVWELVYIAAAILPILTKRPKSSAEKSDRKHEENNIKTGEDEKNG